MTTREENPDWRSWTTPPGGTGNEFDSADVGALAHLYRGEVYRSTIWRTRLDATTNWSVVTLGLAMSISFASPTASPLPLLLVGILISMFLVLEARRYRYFNVWRARCRWIETNFYAPLLLRSHKPDPGQWQDVLAQDYLRPQYHIGFFRAMGRRLREAAAARRAVRLTYVSRDEDGRVYLSDREVELWRVRLPRLEGLCLLRSEPRIFRLDRIHDVQVLDRTYVVPVGAGRI